MKVVRVIKWIAFVVFVLAFALNLVANGFIIADVACVAKENSAKPVFHVDRFTPDEKDLRVCDVKEILADLDYGMDNIRALLQPYAANVAADNTVADPTPVETPVEDEPVVVIPEVTEPVVTDDQGVASSGSVAYDNYDVKDHCNLVVGVMKYGTATCEFKWITGPLGFERVTISISFFVALVALLISFIMHIIAKRYKTVYGTILMIIGFIFMFGMLLIGVYASELLLGCAETFVTTDTALVQIFAILACGILGTLIGLPIYSCGVRQITNKRLRRRLRRRSSH